MTDTRTICELDGSGFWTGQALDIGPLDGRPPAWVETAAPPTDTAVPAGQGWAWLETWVLTDLPKTAVTTFADGQAAKAAAVNTRRDVILTGGYSHDFGGSTGVKVLQTATADDDTNWLTLQASCTAAVLVGQGATVGAIIRTLDNVNIPLSYADGLQVMLSMSAWGASVYAASWKLKDAIAAATDQSSLDTVDITAGWPANP